MITKRIKAFALCAMLLSNTLNAEIDQITGDRYFLVTSTTVAAAYFFTQYLCKKKIIKQIDNTTFAKRAIATWWLTGQVGWCYDYPFTYPIQCIESAAIWTLKTSWHTAKTVASASFCWSNAVISSAKNLDSNFIWGSTCVGLTLGLGSLAWHYHNKYKRADIHRKTTERISHQENIDLEDSFKKKCDALEKEKILLDLKLCAMNGQIRALEQRLNKQSMDHIQPGLPPPSAPPASLYPSTISKKVSMLPPGNEPH